MGRVGRIQPGHAFFLYTENTFNSLEKEQIPVIYTSDAASFILKLYQIDSKIDNIKLIDNISIYSKMAANDKLFNLGLIDYNSEGQLEINEFGKIINSILLTFKDDLRLEIIKMILSGFAFGVSLFDLITIAAFLPISQKSFDMIPIESYAQILRQYAPPFLIKDNMSDQQLVLKYKLLLSSDFIEPLILFYAFMNNIKDAKNWANKMHIPYGMLLSVASNREEIIDQLLSAGVDLKHGTSLFDTPENLFIQQITNIKHCIYEGFKLNIVTWSEAKKTYLHGIYNDLFILSPIPCKFYNTVEKELLSQNTRPMTFITSEFKFKINNKYNKYDIEPYKIDTLDGFIVYDPNLLI
jgi:HrpA-like RNA helicase